MEAALAPASDYELLYNLVHHFPGTAYRCRYVNQRLYEFISEGCYELTAYDAAEIAQQNSIDNLIHPDDLLRVQQQLRLAFIRETPYNIIYRLIRKDKTILWVRDQGRGLFEKGELVACEGYISNITATHKQSIRLSHNASHDELTGLYNRHYFEQRIEHALAHAKVNGEAHTLCYLDLDQFKLINNSAGHRAGDELLRHIAVLLQNQLGEGHLIARLGGDEFGILMQHCSVQKSKCIADKLVSEINILRFPWEQYLFKVSASIGMVEINAHNESVSALLSQADIACYAAKDLGRNRVHIYQANDTQLLQRHSEILRVSSLREALEKHHFRLYCQPIKALNKPSNGHKHYEVLLRLTDNEGNILLPGAFIPAAERFGLMDDIDRWVIAKLLDSYEEFFQGNQNIQFTLNLSGGSLSDPGLITYIKALLNQHTILPQQLCFEITETAAVQNLQCAIAFIEQCKALGCQFALDDFGSGLSSFAYLKYFPVDYLKIDGGFVRDMITDRNDRVLVAAINEIGHIMGMKTIAEWAETDEIIESLCALQVDYVQGSAIGKPIPLDGTAVVGL